MPAGGKREGAGRKKKSALNQLSPATIKEFQNKIKTTWLLKKLEKHIETTEGTMVPSAVTAAIALLGKVLPNLASVEHSGQIDTKSAELMTDNELAAIASRSSDAPDQAPIDPSKLN